MSVAAAAAHKRVEASEVRDGQDGAALAAYLRVGRRRMIRLTRTQIDEALPRVARGLEQYLWLQRHRHSGDVSTDPVYRRRFNSFYRVRRAPEWQDEFYRLFRKKKAQPVTFGQVLRALHRATGRY